MPAHRPAEILKSFFPDVDPPGSLVPIEKAGFSGASVFRVETEAGPFCLRQWPRGTMSAKRLAGIHRLLERVFQAGVTVVPVPVKSCHGDTVVETGETLWQLEPWMPGTADFYEDPADARLESAMTELARFHRAAESTSLQPTPDATPQTIPERLEILRATRRDLGRIQNGLQHETDSQFRFLAAQIATQFEQRADRIETALKEASILVVPILPCLRDVWHDHLLFSGETLTGLIDFGAVRPDTVAADLSRLPGSLFETLSVNDRPRWETALAHYEQTRPLTTAERQLIRILDESGVLLSGTHWLRLRHVKNTPIDLPRVCHRLELITKRLAPA